MTQEELDALMAGELDSLEEEPAPKIEEEPEEEEISNRGYRVTSQSSWPPPPPTDDHKMVHQLDDVTRDSELKATEVFDKLESINETFVLIEDKCVKVLDLTNSNIDLFANLVEKFPNVDSFQKALEENKNLKQSIDEIILNAQNGEDDIMMTMDIMQYQDIHRQKIERVINVMRALSKYMSSLFEGKIEDAKRVSSAVHIQGDSTTEDIVTNEDIEALIESLGKK